MSWLPAPNWAPSIARLAGSFCNGDCSGILIHTPPPLNRDPNVKALKRRGFIHLGSTSRLSRVLDSWYEDE